MTVGVLKRVPFGWSLFGLVTSVSLLLMGGHSTSVDEETYIASLRGFLHGRSSLDLSQVALSTISGTIGRNGELTSYYGFGTILFNLPMYVVGKFFSLFVGADSKEQVLRLFFYSTNSIVLGLTALCIFKICVMLGVGQRVSSWTAVTFAFCTYALQTAGGGFAEPLTAMFLVWAVYFAVHSSPTARIHFWCGLCLGSAVLMRPSSVLFIPCFGVYLFLVNGGQSRLFRLLSTALGGLAPMVILLGTNWWRFGGILETGYNSIPFSTPLYEGVFGQFFSPGKGLVWFAPMTFLALATVGRTFRRWRAPSLLLWSCVGANTVFFGRYEVWNGDVAFGPRYAAIVLPLIAVLAGLGAGNLTRWGRAFFSIAGLPASIGGALVYFNAANWLNLRDMARTIGRGAYNADGTYNWITMRQTSWFVPRLSQISYHLRSIDDAFRNSWDLARGANTQNIFQGGNKMGLGWYSKAVRIDTWWAYWFETAAPRLFLVGVPLLSAVAIVCAMNMVRANRADLTGSSSR